MKRIKVYTKVANEKIVCMCLKARKLCERNCDEDEVLYDEFSDWEKCNRNIKGWP